MDFAASNSFEKRIPMQEYVFENIMENGASASFGANAPFSIIFSKVFKTLIKFFLNLFQCCLKIENDVMI